MWGIWVIIPPKRCSKIWEAHQLGHLSFCKKFCIVANRPANTTVSYAMCWGPANTALAQCCTSAHMGLIIYSMATSAGLFLGQIFLIVVDGHTKWPAVFCMKSTAAFQTPVIVRSLFARTDLIFCPKQPFWGMMKTQEETWGLRKPTGVWRVGGENPPTSEAEPMRTASTRIRKTFGQQ